jgi:sugar phosphate isomerase/epimerase
MPVRLGISPIGWSNDDLPELGGDTPLETCLAEARLAGFEGIELGNKFPRDPAVLRPILERQGLSLISGWYSGHLLARSVAEEWAAIEAHRALLVAMGCAFWYARRRAEALPASVPPTVTGCVVMTTGTFRGQADRASACCSAAFASPTITMWERWSRARPKSNLMAVTGDSVGLLLDTGHLAFAA